jgi:hypothetical protein
MLTSYAGLIIIIIIIMLSIHVMAAYKQVCAMHATYG